MLMLCTVDTSQGGVGGGRAQSCSLKASRKLLMQAVGK